MSVSTHHIHVSTQGNSQVINISDDVSERIASSPIKDGIVTVSVVGSTGAVTTLEYEPGLIKDIPEVLDRLIPPGRYHHDDTWGDGNGHAHLRASFIGPSVALPFSNKKLLVGTWQQIVFIDFDARPRDRELVVQIVGE